MIEKVAIIGGGSWATALVKIFSESQVNVTWAVRTAEKASFIRENARNPQYLSFAKLDLQFVHPVSYSNADLQDTEMIIFAVPSFYLPDAVAMLDKEQVQGKQLAVSIKGFIPGTGLLPSAFIRNYFESDKPVMVLGGPCHAEEIVTGKSTYLTVSGSDRDTVNELCNTLQCGFLRIIGNNDPDGIEYAAILKNIIGIAGGISNGLNYGDNFQAVLVSNAMREIGCFLDAISNSQRNMFDSAYFGDLLVTAYSEYSRNRTLGKLVGRGIQVNKALQGMPMIAEGFYASREFAPLARKTKLSLPVINSVYRILHQYANPYHEFKLLEKHLC